MVEPNMQDVFRLYQRKVALLSSAQKEKLCAANDEGMSPFVIGCAILRAKQEQRRSKEKGRAKHISFNYIYRIIEDWLNHGITTNASFYAYWGALNEDQSEDKRRQEHVVDSKKVGGEDYFYGSPPQQDRSRFPFLDG